MKGAMPKKILCMVVAALLSAGMVAGCSKKSSSAGPASSSDEKITIKFVTKIPEDYRQACMKKIIAAFQKVHPNITIEQRAYGDEEIKDKLKVLLGSDEAPDIYFSWSGQRLQNYVDQSLALDLTKYLNSDPAWKNSFNQSMLETTKKEGAYYAVPWDYSSKEFFYNRSVFQKAGITALPKTWDQFLQVCQKLKGNGYTPIAVGNQYAWVIIHYITTLNQKLVPADVLQANYSGKSTDFSDPGYVKAFSMLKDLYDKGYINKDVNSATYEMSQSMVIEGKAGMIYDETQIMSKYPQDKFGYFDFPEIAGEKGTPGYVTGGPDLYVVNSKTKYPEQCVEFLKHLTNKESQQAIVKDIQFMPVVEGAATKDTATTEAIEIIEKNQKAPGVAEWLDCVLNQTVANQYLTACQEIFNGKSADSLMAQISQVAASAS